MPSYLELSYGDVGLAALLMLLNGVASVALKLGTERTLLIASVRTVVQLALVGLVLEWIFEIERPVVVLGLMLVMTLVAGVTAVQRNPRRYPGVGWDTILSIGVSSWLITAYALTFVVYGDGPVIRPQVAIPLLGMVLGNALNGVSLGLNTLTESLTQRRDEVETALALGATRWEAARGAVRNAIRTGTIPIINAMMIVGVVSLPGMMTGQLLAGIPPIQTVKYQIVIMFLIASATELGTLGVVLLGYRRLFSRDHQFLASLIDGSNPR